MDTYLGSHVHRLKLTFRAEPSASNQEESQRELPLATLVQTLRGAHSLQAPKAAAATLHLAPAYIHTVKTLLKRGRSSLTQLSLTIMFQFIPKSM